MTQGPFLVSEAKEKTDVANTCSREAEKKSRETSHQPMEMVAECGSMSTMIVMLHCKSWPALRCCEIMHSRIV